MIYTTDDVLKMLDALVGGTSDDWWDAFFTDRAKPCPFFVDVPDENLVEWLDAGLIGSGRALELGCGNGRNAAYLAGRGHAVDAIDFSAEAIAWAEDRGAAVDFRCCSIFDAALDDEHYDLVYDSGCFHHMPPHRRKDYVELVDRVLKPGGRYGLVCFRPEGGGGFTDQQVYERRSLGSGLSYPEADLRALWDEDPFEVDVLRRMRSSTDSFGKDFLWTLLAAKRSAGAEQRDRRP